MLRPAGRGFEVSGRLLVLALATASPLASAQTKVPGEVLGGDSYRGSVERQRQQDAAATRDQAALDAGLASGKLDPAASAAAQSAASGRAADLRSAYDSWMARPPLPADRNPLLGRWAAQAPTQSGSGPMDGMLDALVDPNMVNQMGCGMLFGEGVVEFRPDSVVTLSNGTESRMAGTMAYRGGGKNVVALQRGGGGALLDFDFVGPDRINLNGAPCQMTRVGPATASGGESGATATAALPPVKSRTFYRCPTETIYVDSCARDRDKPGYRPRTDAENLCIIYFPDRPKPASGALASDSALERDLAAMVRGCKIEPAAAH